MHKKDKMAFIKRYEGRLQQFGYSPKTLGWGKDGRQEVRFQALTEPIMADLTSSILDVGCGFADLYDYLRECGWKGDYCGLDIVPGLLQIARERHPHLELHCLDITRSALPLRTFDYVLGSGVFNAKLKAENNLSHVERAVGNMVRLARKAVCIDFMSTYVDFQHPDGWHTDPVWAFTVAKKLSRRVMLKHDYMPFEFALIIYRDDSISPRNVFQAVEAVSVENKL